MSSLDTVASHLQPLRSMIRDLGAPRHFAANEIIFEADAYEESMYLLDTGSVLLVFKEDWRETCLGPGSLFGELSLILPNHRRSATAIAQEETILRCIDRQAFDWLRKESPGLLVDLLLHTSAYLLSSEFRLVDELRARQRELEQALDYLKRTKQELSAREIETLTDPLTEIYNRRCFEQHLQRYTAATQDIGNHVALIVVDLDHFKQINDRYGHAAGDLVLKKVASVIKDSLRHVDLPCRIGGDEFAALLPDTDEESCIKIAKRVFDSISGLKFSSKLNGLSVSASVGGGIARPGENWTQFFERIDKEQLYAAKAAGRYTLVWEGNKLF